MGIYEEMPLNFDLKRMWKEGVWAIGHEFGHNVQWMTGRPDTGYFFGKSAVTVFLPIMMKWQHHFSDCYMNFNSENNYKTIVSLSGKAINIVTTKMLNFGHFVILAHQNLNQVCLNDKFLIFHVIHDQAVSGN